MTGTATKTQETFKTDRSSRLFERAKAVIPGGVNSPVRSCKSVGHDPIFINRADGAYMYDQDGNSYIDYVGSWGPMILGHRHPRVLEALEDALALGTSFGAPSRLEVEMAELICEIVPSIEMVRMVNSGTEACMSAVRLARAFTGRELIVKFDGCYHGHADSFLVKAGSGLATLGISSSPGVPEAASKLTLSIPYNDVDKLREVFAKKGSEIAALILEPIVGNSGLIKPNEEFLKAITGLCRDTGALLIFDEVMTGFRVALGGAQEMYGIKPDLTCFGKVIGGGLPVGAYGGRKDIMERIAPQGDVYQAGTLSGNPLAMAAGLAQLKFLRANKDAIYKEIARLTDRLHQGLDLAAQKTGVAAQISSVPGMLSFFFTKNGVTDYESAATSDTKLFGKVWRGLLQSGVYWPPSQFETSFLSLMHSNREIDETIKVFDQILQEVK